MTTTKAGMAETAECLAFAGNAQFSSARDVGQPHAWPPPEKSTQSRSRSGLASQELTGPADPCFDFPFCARVHRFKPRTQCHTSSDWVAERIVPSSRRGGGSPLSYSLNEVPCDATSDIRGGAGFLLILPWEGWFLWDPELSSRGWPIINPRTKEVVWLKCRLENSVRNLGD